MSDGKFSSVLAGIISGKDLSAGQAEDLFNRLMDGQLTEAQTAGLLTSLACKGETSDEITGAARAMREHSLKIDAGGLDVVDTCGTGGTGLSTFNISTAAAFVAAGAGAKVAKHGNRTNTRASGSADVLAALGVNIDASPETASKCLANANCCFCFAVRCHPAMKYAVPVRKQLAVRTIFNVLGPLTNPAGAKRQVMGVFDAKLTETIAAVLFNLGAIRAMVVHADDGLDEISITCETKVTQLKDGKISTHKISPEDFNLPRAKPADIAADSPEESAEIIRAVLDGKKSPARDIVLLNSAAALDAAGLADSIKQGIELAEKSIDSKNAKSALQKLIDTSNEGS